MTQAFNLSQFANKVNTSGQADLTTAVTGVLPTANGGTGLSSPGASGNVLRSNGSIWQSVALPDYLGNKGQVFNNGAIFIASKSTTVMTVTSVIQGTLYVGQTIWYNNASMTITSFGTGTGGTGTYNVSVSGTVSSRPWSGGWTGTFTIPTGITELKATVVGGGGAGGNSANGNISSGGGGGGAAISYLTGLTPGNTISITLGYATATSSITYGATTISATGGIVGTALATSTYSVIGMNAGGVGSGGNINVAGGSSGLAICYPVPCVGAIATSSYGGSSILSQGADNAGNTNGINGLAGAGGGGTYGQSPCVTRFGGMGGPGVVIFEW